MRVLKKLISQVRNLFAHQTADQFQLGKKCVNTLLFARACRAPREVSGKLQVGPWDGPGRIGWEGVGKKGQEIFAQFPRQMS